MFLRYDVTFEGRVQGVFFRATAEEIARGFEVTGYVRNRRDGSVHCVAEGEEAELDRFFDAIREAKSSNIQRVEVVRTAPTREFDCFVVRH